MGTLAEKLTYLSGTKTAIKTAIVNKGVSVTDADTFRSYANKISSISSKYTPSYLNTPFFNYTGTDLSYEIENLDVSYIYNYFNFFRGCSLVTTFDLSSWTMGANQPNESLSFTSMFYGCQNLTSVTFNNANRVNVIQEMFQNCNSLVTLDLSKLSGTLLYSSNAFYGCTSLTHLDVRNLVFSGMTTSSQYNQLLYNVNTNCEIIVKDATEKTWFNNKFSSYTNVKTVAEYEGN